MQLLGISDARESSFRAGLQVILDLSSPEIFFKGCPARSALRLRELGLWRNVYYGHFMVLSEIGGTEAGGYLDIRISDYVMPFIKFDAGPKGRNENRVVGRCTSLSFSLSLSLSLSLSHSLSLPGVPIFADTAKMDTGTEVYCEELRLNL